MNISTQEESFSTKETSLRVSSFLSMVMRKFFNSHDEIKKIKNVLRIFFRAFSFSFICCCCCCWRVTLGSLLLHYKPYSKTGLFCSCYPNSSPLSSHHFHQCELGYRWTLSSSSYNCLSPYLLFYNCPSLDDEAY